MTENIIVAIIGALGLVLIEAMRRQNTRQHGSSLAALADAIAELRTMKADIRDVKEDVRDLAGGIDRLRLDDARRHEENLVRLEHHDEELEKLAARLGALEPPGDPRAH